MTRPDPAHFSSYSMQSTLTKLKEGLADSDIALVSGFPAHVDQFVELLGALGEVLENYEIGAGDGDPQGSARFVNRVRIDPDGRLLHHRPGELPLHSARSWSHPRPRFFAMLMIDPGCQDGPEGENGETLLVRWRDALQLMSRESSYFRQDFDLLTKTPLPFSANRVREAASNLPLVYALDAPRDELDYGVRWKYDLAEKVPALFSDPAKRKDYLSALTRFSQASTDRRVRRCMQLRARDLLVIDNNRVGHGRCRVREHDRTNGQRNVRELWSAAVR